MTKADIAEVVHGVIRLYKLKLGEEDVGSWAEATKMSKDSTLIGVEYVMNNPNTTAEHQHEAWCKHKEDTGWLPGKVDNDKLKTSTLLIPFSDIALKNQTKSTLFINVVKSLLPMQQFI